MSHEVPYSSGTLQDWPIFAEIIEEALERVSEAAGAELSDDFRDEVVADVRQLYERMNKKLSVSLELTGIPLGAQANVERQIAAAISEVVKLLHSITNEALSQRILTAIQTARLRQRLRALGEDC